MGMSSFPYAWGDDSPEPLIYSAVRKVACNPEVICKKDDNSSLWLLKPEITLPQELCERLLNIWQDLGSQQLTDEFLTIFGDRDRTRLKRVTLSNSSITDEGLRIILSHKVEELDILQCEKLTKKSFEYLNRYGENLISLTICKNIFRHYWEQDPDENYVLNTPKLLKFVLHNYQGIQKSNFYSSLLKPMRNILHLDLSGCSFMEDLMNINELQHLRILILFNMNNLQKLIPLICCFKNLRVLDISQEKVVTGMINSPDRMLRNIISNLPNLSRLDISGTNLAGSGIFTPKTNSIDMDDVQELSDIPGLQSRMIRPLDFLGLYNTFNSACKRHTIPAVEVTGDANEKQVLAAVEAYLDRPTILTSALNELYQLFRYETCTDHKKALNLILQAMMKHKGEKHIQILGSASLFYIAKEEEKSKLNFFAKRKMISVLLDAMDNNIEDTTMMRNGCLTICQFRIPQDIESGVSYRRLVNLLLSFVKSHIEDENFVNKVAMYLLNSLACQVDGPRKELVGDLGAIETMLDIINVRLMHSFHDDVLEIAWSTMWNVTDETPVNCQRFLDSSGMRYFQKCLVEFPDKEELLRNMMGLLGNVAEVKELRPRLLNSDFIHTFTTLLDSTSDGIEVSYNAAGVLSHIASDGPDSWTIDDPSREYVLRKMVTAIERWDLNSKRNINYRSFEPILRLLKVDNTPECQLWAVWALANLTTVQPCKYCPLVEEEGGLQLIDALAASTSGVHILRLIANIRSNCENN